MEIVLSPSILSADFFNLGAQVKECESAGAKYLHIDVMDGIFVPNISFAFPVIESLRNHTELVFDVHLMITQPERYIERFIKSGADIITFHIESTENPEKCIEIIKSAGIRAGVAINPNTPVSAIKPYIGDVDMVLCMTVEAGYGGQSYINSVDDKIREVRSLAPDLDIQVDGGINKENICEPIKAGANIIVAGTSVFKNDITANINELLKNAERGF